MELIISEEKCRYTRARSRARCQDEQEITNILERLRRLKNVKKVDEVWGLDSWGLDSFHPQPQPGMSTRES